jgi:hypothetical protein
VGEVILVFIKPDSTNPITEKNAPFNMPEVSRISHLTSAIL